MTGSTPPHSRTSPRDTATVAVAVAVGCGGPPRAAHKLCRAQPQLAKARVMRGAPAGARSERVASAPPCVNTQAPTDITLPHQLDATRSTAAGPLAQAQCAGALLPPGPGPPHPPVCRRRPRWPSCGTSGPSEGAATRGAARRRRRDAARTATRRQAAAAGGRGRRCAPPSTQWPHRRCGRGA